MNIYKENRSLSPHLRSYKPQITSVISIFHRITGSVLALLLLCTPICVNLAGSFLSFRSIYVLFSCLFFVVKLFIYLLIATVFFHSMNGLRHIMWDFCIGLELSNVFISGCLVVFLSLFLSCFTIFL
jgi:succinate dehydrogenase / fumarate reductase cytochrome b subunit